MTPKLPSQPRPKAPARSAEFETSEPQDAKPLKNGTRIPDEFSIGARSAGPKGEGAPAPAASPIHRKTHLRMKRGKLAPERRIDLHGLTLAEAQPRLAKFILDSHAEGRRLVLVITGKGKARDSGGPIPERPGVLRRHVPEWLRSGVLAAAVLDVTPAHQRHGGEGAFYVYLRRR